MHKGIIIAIPVAIAIIIAVSVSVMSSGDSGSMDVGDILNKDVTPAETPEIAKKLEDIEKIANDSTYTPEPRVWQTSGPFQIDRTQYALGEKIFIRIGGLQYQDKGEIAFMRPLNATHYAVYITIPFDGAQKNAFNYYIDPQLNAKRKLCSADDVLGKWAVVFRGTNYQNLYFDIVNKTVPGTNWDPVC